MSNSVIKDTEFNNNSNDSRIREIVNTWGKRALIHDIIKIDYVRKGYIQKNYPPHLISDEEMIYAFLPPVEDREDPDKIIDTENPDEQKFEDDFPIFFFKDYYPKLDGLSDKLISVYYQLKRDIKYHLKNFLNSHDDKRKLPNWVYSYMLGVPLSVKSPKDDIHDFLVIVGNDNIDDLYLSSTADISYDLSIRYLMKYPVEDLDRRPPTIYGEPHVLRYANLLYGNEPYTEIEDYR